MVASRPPIPFDPQGLVALFFLSVMAILGFYGHEEIQETRDMIQQLRDGSIPTFPSLERGAHALKNALEAHRMETNRNT